MRSKRRQARNKTVFILGAGFTRSACGPTQSELLSLIARRRMSRALRLFLERVFQAVTRKQIARLSIEDLFTVLDRAALFRENVRGISYRDVDGLRRELISTLVRLLYERLDYPSEPHTRFAEELVRGRLNAGLEGDPFSVISFNWDILLDQTLHDVCSAVAAQGLPPAMIDYCCFTYALDPRQETTGQHVSSALVKFSGIYNLKLLKLHGSVNWLRCPQCDKLHVTFDRAVRLNARSRCPSCSEGSALEPLIITPTLLKDLQTTHLKTVWHNAITELQEAGRLVFIGYSFPLADFEFRYLLAKGVSKDASITVVGKRPPSRKGRSQREQTQFDLERHLLEQRYRSFFGRRRIEFLNLGAEEYIAGKLFES